MRAFLWTSTVTEVGLIPTPLSLGKGSRWLSPLSFGWGRSDLLALACSVHNVGTACGLSTQGPVEWASLGAPGS